jgi:hypothetical protein
LRPEKDDGSIRAPLSFFSDTNRLMEMISIVFGVSFRSRERLGSKILQGIPEVCSSRRCCALRSGPGVIRRTLVGTVFIGIFWIAPSVFAFASDQLRMVLFETVGDVFEEIRPRTTCLYSAASMLLRNLSAASHSFCSKPMLAELLFDLVDFARAMIRAAFVAEPF